MVKMRFYLEVAIRIITMQACQVTQDKFIKEFPPFDVERLLRAVFEPMRGERVCILIDLNKPEEVIEFAFLQNIDLHIPRKAYASFYRELRSGVMQHLGLGGCDFYAYASTGGHDLDFPKTVTAPDGAMYQFETEIFPCYEIFLAITNFAATAPLAAAAKRHGFRGAAMHGLNYETLRTGLSVDYNEVSRETEKIRKGLTHADSLDIDFDIENLHYSLHLDIGRQEAKKRDGLCRNESEIVNLPAGEVYFIPTDATGSFPIKFPDGTIGLCQVDQKRVHTVFLIQGNQDIVDEWQWKLDRNPILGSLLEFSLGTQALPFTGSDIQDEKILGTFHLIMGKPEPIAYPRSTALMDIFFSPAKTPEITVKQVRMKRQGKAEILVENYDPASYLTDPLGVR